MLRPFTTYYYIIAASTAIGRGPFSTVFTLLMPEDGMLGEHSARDIYIYYLFYMQSQRIHL